MSVVPSFRKVLANDTGVAENASSVWVSLRLAGIFFVQLMRTGVKCGPLDVFRARFGLPRAAGRRITGVRRRIPIREVLSTFADPVAAAPRLWIARH